jgi:hypothetical protein
LIACCTLSCREDASPVPAKVTGITHQPDYGAITFHWQHPADEDFFYMDIRYTLDGVEYSQKASKYADSTTIEGLSDNSEMEFRFYAVNSSEVYSDAIAYSAAPFPPPFNVVAETISLDSSLDGEDLFNEVGISWTNETGKQVTIEVAYINDAGEATSSSFVARASGRSTLGNFPGGPRTFTVVVKDDNQHTSDARNFTVNVLNAIYMDRSGWIFPGYDPASRYGTIGYSSQATNEDRSTYPVNGSVLAMLDDQLGSYWHVSWTGPRAYYPHWFIIDFGSEATLTHVEMATRQGNTGGQLGFQVLTCTGAGATNPADPTTWNWQDQGEYPFVPTINDLQKFRLPNKPTARYIQIYFAEHYKGSTHNAMASEFGVYALEE